MRDPSSAGTVLVPDLGTHLSVSAAVSRACPVTLDAAHD